MDTATFILFGATGDLAKRKIYPALYNLYLDGMLPEDFSLIGLGRREWSDDLFRSNVEQSLRQYSRREARSAQSIQAFVSMFRYSVLDIDRKEDYVKLLDIVKGREAEQGLTPNRLFYLSVGPEYFEAIADHVQASGLGDTGAGWKRLVIEKPFGRDLESARKLNLKLSEGFAKEEIFIIDHYLGKPMVHEFAALRQNNPIIKALWKNRNIANVQITAGETVGVEERAGYYDHVGALRDMFQNHMLQLLMMTAVQLPSTEGPEEIRLKKKRVMEDLQPLARADVARHVIRGQYGAGRIAGHAVNGYSTENGIPAGSVNETFVAARLMIDDELWRGIPFYIRTGKRMKEKSTRIVIEFKEPIVPTIAAGENQQAPNLLIVEMSPEEKIQMQINVKEHPLAGRSKPVQIDLYPSRADLPEAYENLINGALQGDFKYFAHWDEVELAWQWAQPVLEAFAEGELPLHSYEAGSYGPEAADELLNRDGFRWWFDDNGEEAPAVLPSKQTYAV